MPARSRLILAVGFGGLLSIMAAAGMDALGVLQRFHNRDQQIRSRNLSRSEVYVSGTHVRGYVHVSIAAEPDSDGLPDEYKTCIYRVVQEALRNRARHSNATTVRIRVGHEPGRFLPSIHDNGRDFDAVELPFSKNDEEESRSAYARETDTHPVG